MLDAHNELAGASRHGCGPSWDGLPDPISGRDWHEICTINKVSLSVSALRVLGPILIDKYIDRSDFELLEMDTDSNYFAFSEDSIEKLIKPEMREEYEKDKYNFLPSESKELHPTFQVDGVRFTWAQYDKRKPGLFKVETTKDKMISLCSKMYCASDITEEKIKFSCKGIQKDGNNVNYQKFHNVLFYIHH